jgi:hypothetical protein
MADWFRTRAPLPPQDAAYFRKNLDAAEQEASMPFQSEMARLGVIAQAKRAAERTNGPIDQDASLRFAMKFADDHGISGGTPQYSNALKGLAWLQEEPDSRNVFLQASLAPEQMLMHASEALSGDKTLSERGARLATAIPAAFFPEVGYPIQGAYDRMYDANPVAGALMDFVGMPDVGSSASAIRKLSGAVRYGGGVPTHLIDQQGNVIRRLRNSPPSSR